eukprot:1703792-Rhodomonas_salina.1
MPRLSVRRGRFYLRTLKTPVLPRHARAHIDRTTANPCCGRCGWLHAAGGKVSRSRTQAAVNTRGLRACSAASFCASCGRCPPVGIYAGLLLLPPCRFESECAAGAVDTCHGSPPGGWRAPRVGHGCSAGFGRPR